jgi:uncharacterized protein with GYD domain
MANRRKREQDHGTKECQLLHLGNVESLGSLVVSETSASKGRFDMPIFITQGRFTREYVKGGLAKPEDRHAAISKLCEQAGGKMLSVHFTLGHYDFMLLTEMPDAKAAAMIALAAAGGGGIEGTATTQAFTTAEAKDLFASAGKIAKSYKPMGAS